LNGTRIDSGQIVFMQQLPIATPYSGRRFGVPAIGFSGGQALGVELKFVLFALLDSRVSWC
jgi:hypothetical protein